MMEWCKVGKIFDPREHELPWMAEFAQCPATLLRVDGLRVFFSCRPPRDAHGQYVSRIAYVDFDRTIWPTPKVLRVSQQPLLPLGDPGCYDEHGSGYPASVIRSGAWVLMYFGGWRREVSVPFDVAIGRAVSFDDGDTFTKPGNGPVLGASEHEPFVISGPKIRRLHSGLMMYYIAGCRWIEGKVVYKIRVALSKNGRDWIRYGSNIIDDLIGPNECQAGPDVFQLRNDPQFHMLFSYRAYSDHRYRVGYAVSADGFSWKRDDSLAGLNLGAPGEWDDECQTYPHVFKLNKRTWCIYNGNEVGRWGFGLAELKS